jgi:hypothetical protein
VTLCDARRDFAVESNGFLSARRTIMGFFDQIGSLLGGNKDKVLEDGKGLLTGEKSLADLERDVLEDTESDNDIFKTGKGLLRDKLGLGKKEETLDPDVQDEDGAESDELNYADEDYSESDEKE